MKSKFLFTLAAVLTTTAAHASELVLPDSCGSDKVTFEVSTKKSPGALSSPADGKARIVFLDVRDRPRFGEANFVARYGVDGAWAGATKGDSYFTFDVDPGERHLCASVQHYVGMGREQKDFIAMYKLTAEAGKIYYIEYSGGVEGGRVRAGTDAAGNPRAIRVGGQINAALAPADEEEGKYRAKSTEIAVFTKWP